MSEQSGQPQVDNSSQNVNSQLQDEENIEDQLKASKIADWKRNLTGALDEKRLLGSLVVLCIFYVGYVLFNAVHNNNANDEDNIVQSCTCKPTHRNFYIGWSIFCYFLWICWHLMIFFFYEFPPTVWCRKRCSSGCKSAHATSYSVNDNGQGQFQRSFFTKTVGCLFHSKSIYRYESYLWTRYYELYVIGITKNESTFNLENVQKYMAEALSETDDTDGSSKSRKTDKLPLTDHDQLANQNSKTEPKSLQADMALPVSFSNYGRQYWAQMAIHVSLSIIRLIAQFVIVPLLMIQMFDTYAFLCFAADNYCSMTAEYNLHLDQTAITFGFYCSLMVSLLTTTMLRWIPLPKKITYDNNNVTCQSEQAMLY